MRRKTLLPAILIGLGASGPFLMQVSPARAESQDFHLIGQSVEVDRVNDLATFSLTFDQRPSFVAIDGGQLKAFQYEIDLHTNSLEKPIDPTQISTVIRGGEIWEGNGLPIREATGNGGEHAGGWGPIKTFVPFEVNDNTLSFTTTFADLGDSDGKFRYRVITTDSGGLTSDMQGAAIPLPSALVPGAVMLGAIAVSGRLWRRRVA